MCTWKMEQICVLTNIILKYWRLRTFNIGMGQCSAERYYTNNLSLNMFSHYVYSTSLMVAGGERLGLCSQV